MIPKTLLFSSDIFSAEVPVTVTLAGALTTDIQLAGVITIALSRAGALTTAIQMQGEIGIDVSIVPEDLKTANKAKRLDECGHPLFTKCGSWLTN